ncbi:bifunctional DNA primase/polymerase [Rhodococcus sp. NPDC003322]
MPHQHSSTPVPPAIADDLESSQPQSDPDNVREIKSAEPFKTSAHEYLSKGWAGPIPLPSQDKFPPPRGWTGRNGGYPDSAQIDFWLARKDKDATGENENRVSAYRPKANIGLHLGQVDVDGKAWEVVGIDSDNYNGKRGDDIIRELEGQLGPLPETWTSSARTDGVSGIRYFLVPVGLAWRGNLSEVGDGVDIIQKVHRYAVVYPSWHPDGGQYLWYAPGRCPDGKPSPWYSSNLTVAGQSAEGKIRFTRRHDPKIPYADELAILPTKWVQYLTRGGMKDQGVPIDMDSPACGGSPKTPGR